MSTQPLVFTGISQFSDDFQTILNRTLQIASFPITSLQNDQAKILTQKQLLTNLGGVVATLADRIKDLGDLGSRKALVATSSNTAKVTVNSTVATEPATYTLSDITSVARGSSATSVGKADAATAAVSTTGTVRLTINGVQHDITLTAGENNLNGLRDKINALGAGVTATVLTTSTGPTPYYLSITSTTTGYKPVTLVDDPEGANTNLLASIDDGANAVFKINGASVSKSSNLINDVVPGVTFTIAGTTSGAETVTLTLASDRSRLSGAVRDLVTVYNNVRAQVDAQIGPAAGLLAGHFLVREVTGRLRELTTYAGSGAIANLGNLGFELSDSGEASFNQVTFDALSDSQIEAAFEFLGSETTGFGGLSENFTVISDPVTGLIKLEQDQYDKTDQSLSDQIAVIQDRLAALRSSVTAKLQAADALLARLEAQQTLLDASIKSLNYVLYGKNKEFQ